MRGETFLWMLNEIDADLLLEAEAAAAKRPRVWIRAAAAVAAAAALMAGVISARYLLRRPGETPDTTIVTPPDSAGCGGTPSAVPSGLPIVRTGTEHAVDDAAGRAHLVEMLPGLRATLAASGVPTASLTVSAHGYSHLKVTETEAVLAVDFRDYLLWDGDALAAIVTVTGEADGMHVYLAFGGAAFADYAALLHRYAGQELAMLYLGELEAVLTPDGTLLSLPGEDLTARIEALDEADRAALRQPENVYVPE